MAEKKEDRTLMQLNEYLFEQLERLSDPKLEGDALEVEIRKSKVVTDVAKTIIDNADLVLRAAVAKSNTLACNEPLPKMLAGK